MPTIATIRMAAHRPPGDRVAPGRAARLIVPDVAFIGQCFLHEAAAEPFLEIADRICAPPAPPAPTGQPLYLSRSGARVNKRRPEDEHVFEEFLRGEGVLVIHPETLPLAEQIRLARSHEVIIGARGSALHLTSFTRHRPRVSMLTTGGVSTRNFPLWADVLGAPLTSIQCTAFANPGDPSFRRLLAFAMETAAACLHAEGIISTPFAPGSERRSNLAGRMANAGMTTSTLHAG